MRVLIAEDDRFLINAYKAKLEKSGLEVKIATDGQEAIDALQDFTPDVILMDLVMPKKDGFTALEEIKKVSAYKGIPVIVTSNLGQKEDLDKAKSLGAEDYVIKSDLSLDVLIEKIKTVTNAGNGQSTL